MNRFALLVLVVNAFGSIACAASGVRRDTGSVSDAAPSDANFDSANLDANFDANFDAAFDASVVDSAVDAANFDASVTDAGFDAGFDAGHDGGPPDLGPIDAPVVCDPCGACDTNSLNDCFLCGGANTDGAFVASSSTGGPNLYLAMRFTTSAMLKIKRAEVFTGEDSGTNTLSLWTDNAVGPEPLAMGESASFVVAEANGWQGVNFASVSEYVAGSAGWLVWQPQTGQQSSIAPSGASVTYRGAFNAPTGWNGPFSGFSKFRFYCVP